MERRVRNWPPVAREQTDPNEAVLTDGILRVRIGAAAEWR